jgi:hypothetical protein
VGQDAVHFRFTATNTGTVELTDLQLSDTDFQAEIDAGCALTDPLAPGKSTECIIGPFDAAAGQHRNTATLSASFSGTDDAHYFGFSAGIAIEKTTKGQDADQPPGPTIDEGKLVRWRYRVANTGDVALKDVVLVDDVEGVVTNVVRGDDNNDAILDVGETWTFVLDGTASTGQYANVGTVTGTPIDAAGMVIGDAVSASDPSHYLGLAAALKGVIIDVEKFTIRVRNGVETAYQADNPPGPALVENQPVKWRYVVTNEGDVPAVSVVVTDEATFEGVPVPPPVPVLVSGDAGNDGILEPGETWILEAEGTVMVPDPQAGVALGQYANVATVTAEDAQGNVDTATDESHYLAAFLEGINIEKSTNSLDADEAPGPTITDGKAVRWRYRVDNDGNVGLKDVTVTDDREGDITALLFRGDDNDNGILDKGEAWVYRLVGTAREGQYSNTATITGTPVDVDGTVISDPVSDSDVSHYLGVP